MPYSLKKCYLILLLLISTSIAHSVKADSQAVRINNTNAENFVQQGPDATGGINDWFLTNGTVCAVISDVEHESELSSKGGVLIDLGFCDRADDHLTFMQDLLDGSRSSPMVVRQIMADKSQRGASVTTISEHSGVEVTTRYSLNEDHPSQLFISKTFKVIDQNIAEFNLYSTAWFNYHSLETFIYSATNPQQARGFNNIDIVTRGISAIRDATSNADLVALLSPPDAEHPISYGWQLKSAQRVSKNQRYDLPNFIVSDEESTAMLVLADSFYLGDGSSIGLLQLPQIPLLSLAEQDVIEIEEVIYLGQRADVASISDQLLSDGLTVSGNVEEINSVLHVYQGQHPITFVRPDRNGHFEFKLLAGDYRIEHRGVANRSVEHDLQIVKKEIELGTLTLPKSGELLLPRDQAMRLVVVGINGTADPDFEDRLTGYSVTSDDQEFRHPGIRQLFLAGVESDPISVSLRQGDYRVYATRGPEYSLSSLEIRVEAGKQSTLDIEPPAHQVKTPGYISADLHVHAGVGFDNTFSTTARVKTFVAEHAEVMVASEHDVPMDYAPLISSMNLKDKVASIAAVEMTSLLPTTSNPYTTGHINFFPVMPKPYEFRKGMINHEGRRLREVIGDFRDQHPAAIAQLNHARHNLSLSGEIPKNYQELIDTNAYLDHMGEAAYPYNPEKELHTHPNNYLVEPDPHTGLRDIDFQAMEIINPGGPYHQERIDALRKDWLSFIKQGFRITATANSDSHHSGQQVGLPRTMVAMTSDDVVEFNQAEFVQAIKLGNAYGTSGPMMDIELTDQQSVAKMGETFIGSRAQLSVLITSVDWIPVDAIEIQINGETVITSDLEGNNELSFDLDFDRDSFITVEVTGSASDEYKVIYPGITPYAFSNPIYVDFDSDGVWQPPGL